MIADTEVDNDDGRDDEQEEEGEEDDDVELIDSDSALWQDLVASLGFDPRLEYNEDDEE